jgi:tetratricopeptide (TPR) repeat protein
VSFSIVDILQMHRTRNSVVAISASGGLFCTVLFSLGIWAASSITSRLVSCAATLASSEATAGQAQEAKTHAHLALRLSPRDNFIGSAHLALAMANFTLRDYAEAVRWCESAIQVSHRAPIRRALMIACSARAGDMVRARAEIAVLNSFAPGFIASLFRGENPVFAHREDMEHLLDGLRLAGLPE